MTTESNRARIADFCEIWPQVWAQQDLQPMLDFFTDDIVWQDIPGEIRTGKQACIDFMMPFVKRAKYFRMEPRNIVASGDLVMLERVDYLELRGVDTVLPVVAVFEMNQGQIKQWRDYFDLNMFERQIPAK
ncbi:MAG: nuclear transport factor 2 family protein [Gammaproteobacteria bacterium]